MKENRPINLFYEEPDPDRWFKFDKYPRRVIRRIVRGTPRAGGHAMIAINLMKGLDRMGVPYRLNNYNYIKKNPEEIVCIIGKPHVLFKKQWENPVLFGAAVFSHPVDHPNLFEQYPNVKKILVPGEWARDMFAGIYGNKVICWPVGTDTDYWRPYEEQKKIDFLLYDKVMWDYDAKKKELLEPLIDILKRKGLTFDHIRYGKYKSADLLNATKHCKAAIFLCEHETQGLAYQQVLSTGTPILCWDQAGYWLDPSYYPHKVKYQPVSSASYWDDRCGLKFSTLADFEATLERFCQMQDQFKPRDYMLENLTLEICAKKYLQIYHDVERGLA
ncbi:MAG TPA: hypothetical protein VHA56_11790 [Mucilaginibacter sp.]|nr:hypothetical protein [Mucilaginibacter sp.]